MKKPKAGSGHSSPIEGSKKALRAESSRPKRRRERGPHDWDCISGILDAGLVAHVGFCAADRMFVIPMTYGRDGRTLLLHGSVASTLLRDLESGAQVCVTVTLIEGLVLAMNYRSIVAFGHAEILRDRREQLAALCLISEHLIAGPCPEVREPRVKELNATTVLRFSIEEASAMVRSGPPQDAASDLKHPVWAGVVPLELKALPPIPDDKLCEGTPIPASVLHYIARRRTAGTG